jgi:asparagine synthase (glutamine-hydrolysing)
VCGIVGFLGDPTGIDRGSFLDAVAHRGPDGRGVFEAVAPGGVFWLGHTRLAIVDLSPTGNQPMSTEDGSLTLAFNGEIYNHRELRTELEGRGQRFRGTSDTEVVLRLFAEMGEKALDRLRGMFAIALWDARAKELLLVRDPFGIKPLYYTDAPTRISFASEVRALLRSGAAKPRLDTEGLESYLAFGCAVEPLTLVRDVRAVPPGGWVRRSAGESTARTGRPTPRSNGDIPKTYEAAVEALIPVFRRAVRQHLIADVPLGVLLSGGIDSGALVTTASREGQPPSTFTVGFEADEVTRNEARTAADTASRFGAKHQLVWVSDVVEANVSEVTTALDQPSIDGVNTYLVCKAVRNAGIKVALSGLGADEIFLGYQNRRRFDWLSAVAGSTLHKAVRSVARVGERLLPDYAMGLQKAVGLMETAGTTADVYAALRGLFAPAAQRALLGREVARPGRFVTVPEGPHSDGAALLSGLEIGNYLTNMLLRDSDAMSMRHGLELRVPFLDRELVEGVVALPMAFKLGDGRRKALLLDVIGRDLPESVLSDSKRGFVLPFHRWLRNELRPALEETLGSPSAAEALGLRSEVVARIWRRMVDGQGGPSYWTRPWGLHVLIQWAKANRVSP